MQVKQQQEAADGNPFLEGISHEGLRSVLGAVAARDPDQVRLPGAASLRTETSSSCNVSAIPVALPCLCALQDEFLAAVKEVGASLQPVFDRRPELLKAFEVMCEPERQITFRVPWLDDSGVLRINRGWRVQFSSAIGPYKGGLRFRDGVNLSIIKFLG